MHWTMKLYIFLVNRIPGIHMRYQNYRSIHSGIGRIFCWMYLLLLNFRYYILHDTRLEKHPSAVGDDIQIRLPDTCESSRFPAESPAQLASRLAKADVVSFDVFDTLILRPYRSPADLFFDLEQQLQYPGLKRIRQDAEVHARADHSQTNETTLEEIWSYVEKVSGISAREGMDTEWQAELDACFANPYFLEVVRHLRATDTKIVICSDMYLSRMHIQQLLTHCGYPLFDDYFISCELQASKSAGTLFPHVRNTMGADLSYIHVGDNPHSDQKQAQRNGFTPIPCNNVNTVGDPLRPKDQSAVIGSIYAGIVNAHLYNGSRQYSSCYEMGFVYGGLFVTGYCQFIHRYLHDNRIQRVLFLARDGEILQKAYLRMYPEDAHLCRYAYCSRLALTKLCAHRFKHHYFNCMVHHKADAGYTLNDILHTMQLEDLLDTLPACGLHSTDLLTRKNEPVLRSFLEKRWEQVLSHYHAEQQEAMQYYASLLDGAASAVAVDVGWVGSGPLMLRYLIQDLWKLDCQMTGIIAGTCGQNSAELETAESSLAVGTLVSYLFSSGHNRDLWRAHDGALGHNLVVELLLSATTPSFRGFTKDISGRYQFNSTMENIDSEAIQQGILDFVELFQKHPLSSVTISGQDAMAPIKILYQNPKWIEALLAESKINANIE